MPRLNKFDFYLFLPVLFLLGFGIGAIASVAPVNLPNHLMYIFISLIFFLIFTIFDFEILLPFSPFIYILSLAFLSLPLIIGTVSRGSIRWINIGQFTVQPSEIVKPFLAIFSAWFWAKQTFSFKRLFIFLALFLPILVLVLLQPDLGSTLVILSIFVSTAFLSQISKKQFSIILLSLFLLVPIFSLSLKNYQKLRLIHFINPYSDPLGEGYNLIQSKITVGSGRLFGQGLGKGSQSHLSFLPERHTDFVFASLSEELGFFGGMIILTLYLLLFLKILKIARYLRFQDKAEFVTAMGLLFYLLFQTIVNIGMNVGLLPITGITLPLISYGGSSLLTTMISLGILENLAQKSKKQDFIEIK